jgi:hypothetical protein
MRYPPQQIQLALNPPKHLLRRGQKLNIPQPPQIPNASTTKMTQNTRWRENMYEAEE